MRATFVRSIVALGLHAIASQIAWGAGAITPFKTVEVESGQLAGGAAIKQFVLGSAVPTKATLELEASGGAYVRLVNVGDSVAVANPIAGANAVVLRASIPDVPGGGGQTALLSLYVDGQFRQTVELSSKQSWVYPTGSEWSNDPGAAAPFKFYNEERFFITGQPLAANASIMLRKEANGTASEYNLDCLDFEKATPVSRPPNSLSVLDYGAKPDSEIDSQQAIQTCVNIARIQKKTVWIPAGTYKVASVVPNSMDFTGVTVQGAGMWYTILNRKPPTTFSGTWRSDVWAGTGTRIYDLSINDAVANTRNIGRPGGGDYGIGASGRGWIIQRVWVQHTDANWLSGTDGKIMDCRVADTWGDGINLNNGTTSDGSKLGLRLTAQNNFIRSTGDDGLATYSDNGPGTVRPIMDGTSFINNTVVGVYWANCLRIAGGKNVTVRGNLLCDAAAENCLVAAIYGDTGHPLVSALVEGNVMLRGGGWNNGSFNRHGMAIGSAKTQYTNIVVRNNTIQDSRRGGIYVEQWFNNVTLLNNRIIHPATTGIWIRSGVTGTGRFGGNIFTNMNPRQVQIRNESTGTFNYTLTP